MQIGTVANDEMERVAGLLVTDLKPKGMLLDYSPESLIKVDQLLANYGHSRGNGDRNMGLVELVVSYFGEVVRRNLGGTWFEKIPPDGATGLLVNEASELWLWCHAIIFKQLEQGNKNLFAIYSDVATRLKEWER
jgi:hypothetical protein